MHRSASLSLGFTAPLARPLAHLPAWAGGHAGLDASIFHAGVRFGFSCLPHFGRGQNAADTIASSTSQKFSKKSFLFYIGGGEKFIKGVFTRFRPPQPPEEFHKREAGGWKAESFLYAWRGWKYPTHPKQSLCSDFSPSGFRCLRSKPALPLKKA